MDYTFFFPQFSNFAVAVLAFILCLSVIVFVHEFGHYLIGKLSGIHAEVFSIGFGPVIISVKDKRGTKWQIAAFPLGGYVKFLGDKTVASNPASEIELYAEPSIIRKTMNGAPLWARFITVAAGPIFNFVFSGVIFFFIYMNQGTIKFPLTVDKVYETPFEQKFEEGDVVNSVNEILIADNLIEYDKIVGETSSNETFTYVVERKGKFVTLEEINQNPPRVNQVLPKSAAISAGLEKGDLILSVNYQKISGFNQIKRLVEASQGAVLKVEYWRKGNVYETELRPLIVDVPNELGGFERIYRIGIVSDYFPFQPATTKQSISYAFRSSIESIYLIIEGSVKGLYHIIFGNISSCNLSGPISIAETSGQMVKQGSLSYLWFIAVLSTAIGAINLFPVPVLDGGHLMFFTVEALLGRKPDPKLINAFMTAGFVLLIGLMFFTIFNDFLCG